MAQYDSYQVVGKKEDVSDIISNIAPTKTPFQSMIGSDTVHNTLFQWQEDTIRAAAANNNAEGFTPTYAARVPTVMRTNVTQILQDSFEVTGTNDVVSKYGRAKESAYQASITASALKRDLEYAFVGAGQAMVNPANNASNRVMGSAVAQIAAANDVHTGGAGTKVSEANLLTVLQAIYTAGGDPNTIQVTPTNSTTVADFAKATGRARSLVNGEKDRAIVNVVEIYVSPFGEQKVVLNRFLQSGVTLIFDPANWKKVVLNGRNWFRTQLAKTGDSEKYMIVGEFSLKHANQLASGMVREIA